MKATPMSSGIGVRYGKIETMTIDNNGVMASVIETVHNYETTKRINRYTAQLFATDRKHLIAELLKLADRLEEDGISDIAFSVKKRTSTDSPYKIELSWTCK
jgi:hypothetical protein